MFQGGPKSQEVQQRILDGQIQRCRDELKKAAHFAQLGDLESTRRRFDRVRGFVKDSRLPAQILTEFKESIRGIEVTGLKKLVDELLERAAACARSDDVAGRAAAIKQAREHIGRVVALGGEADFKDVSEKKIEVLLLTASRQATAAPAATTPRAAFNRPEAAAVPREMRRFKRFTQPTLMVDISGRIFRTINWSIGGMALADWPPDWDSTRKVELSFTAEKDTAKFSEKAEILRVFPENRMASVKFDSVHSHMLKLVQRLASLGRAPQE
jgi:hypothetical protein